MTIINKPSLTVRESEQESYVLDIESFTIDNDTQQRFWITAMISSIILPKNTVPVTGYLYDVCTSYLIEFEVYIFCWQVSDILRDK